MCESVCVLLERLSRDKVESSGTNPAARTNFSAALIINDTQFAFVVIFGLRC
jgi:hypothetical protein